MFSQLFDRKNLDQLKETLGPKLAGSALPLLLIWLLRKRLSIPLLLLNTGVIKQLLTTLKGSDVKGLKNSWPSLLELVLLFEMIKKR